MKQLTACAHCKAVPATDRARFCGQCGKPLPAPPVATLQSVSPQLPGSQLPVSQLCPSRVAVVSPAFDAPITPAFEDRGRRIRFALIASPIIGVGLGAEPAAFIGLLLTDFGLPAAMVPIGAATAFISLTALIAYIIMADKLSFLSALTNRRKIESVAPDATVSPGGGKQDHQKVMCKDLDDNDLEHQMGGLPQFYEERPHQWAKNRGSGKT